MDRTSSNTGVRSKTRPVLTKITTTACLTLLVHSVNCAETSCGSLHQVNSCYPKKGDLDYINFTDSNACHT